MSYTAPAPTQADYAGPVRLRGKSKLRLDRGPLRWWLIVVGGLTVHFPWERFALGTALVVLGAALHLGTKGVLRQNHRLATTGPYRFTRNPFYLANLIAELGLLLVIGVWWVAAVYLAAWAWIYTRQIRSEERTLEGLFGDDYARYRRQVPPLVPLPWRVLPRDPSTGRAFYWRNPNVLRQRAVERALRLASYPLLLLLAAMLWRDGWRSLLVVGSPAGWSAVGFVGLNAVGVLSTALLRSADCPEAGGRQAAPTGA
ncbi:MAG TPA: isoprenylcysteine carboxylmethyltransferase family protein [Humisphaera sp.]